MTISSRQQIVKQAISELTPEYQQMEAGRLPSLLLYPMTSLGLVSKKSPQLEKLDKQEESTLIEEINGINSNKQIPEGKFKIIFRILAQCLDAKENIESIKKSIDETVYNNKTIKFEDDLKKPFAHMIERLQHQKEIEDLKNQIATESSKVSSTETKLQQSESNTVSLQHQLKQTQQANLDAIKEHNEKSKAAQKIKEQEIAELQRRLNESNKLLDESNKQKTAVITKLMTDIKDIESRNGSTQPLISSLTKQVQELLKKLDDINKQHSTTTTQLIDKELQLEAFKDKNIKIQATLENIKIEKSGLESRIQKLEKDIKSSKDTISRIHESKNLLTKSIKDLEEKYNYYKKQHETLKDEKAKLTEKNSKSNESNEKNSAENAKLKKSIEEFTDQLKNARASKNELAIKLQIETDKYSELMDKHHALEIAYDDLKKASGQIGIDIVPAGPPTSSITTRSMFASKKNKASTSATGTRATPYNGSVSKTNS